MSERRKMYVVKKTISNNENVRSLIVVGLMTEKNVRRFNFEKDACLVGKKGELTADVIFRNKVREKTLKIGYAICSTEDKYDENLGISIAKKRAKRSPVGMVSTTSFTMLQDDQCNALVENEANFIEKNLDKYIKK